jgi:hypothetical protein
MAMRYKATTGEGHDQIVKWLLEKGLMSTRWVDLTAVHYKRLHMKGHD